MASASGTPLVIVAGNSKNFYGNPCSGTPLDISTCTGVINYEPSELVITAAAGTMLAGLESLLDDHGQYLPFEPPRYTGNSTLGGTIACGLSGPRRPWTGPVRDYVLGLTCINGRGEILRFGGEVIKNVAGYDLSRLLTGSLGTLAVILDVSLKILPRPESEISLIAEMPLEEAGCFINEWSMKPVPLSGACYFGNKLRIRLSGYAAAVTKTAEAMGLQQEQSLAFWAGLRDHTLDFFTGEQPLWRVSVPAAAITFACPGERLIDWGGALHWIRTDMDAGKLREMAAARGGHATLFHAGGLNAPRFHPLPDSSMQLHRRIKQAFDPAGILNPGRLYPGL